jgi:hypothetical protein
MKFDFQQFRKMSRKLLLLLLLFSNPTRKTKIETANRWETTNSKPPGPIIMANQK